MTMPTTKVTRAITAMARCDKVFCPAALSGADLAGCFSVLAGAGSVGLMGSDVAGVGATG